MLLGNQPHEGEEHCADGRVVAVLRPSRTHANIYAMKAKGTKQSIFKGKEGHPTLGTGGTVQRRDSLEACPQIFQ